MAAAASGGAGGIPIDVRQLMNLSTMGIPAEAIGFKNVTMDSDKAICVRLDGEAKALHIFSLQTGAQTNKFPMPAESGILSPDGKTIAVRAGTSLQIYDIELQKKVKSAKMADDQLPVFWNWIGPATIGIVTGTSVFHWSASADAAEPAKMFDRDAKLAGTQIINYAASPDYKWLMVVGIKAGAAGGAAEGAMQLYSVEKKVAQSLTAHAGCFHATSRLPGRSDTAILFAFVDQKPGEKPKLMIIEVGKDRTAPGGIFRLAPQELPVPADAGADFPVSMQASKKHDVVYILTKMGYCYVYDIPSGGVIFRHKVADMPVFTSTVHEPTGGVIAITARTGQVFLVTLNTDNLVRYVSTTLHNQALAMSLAGRLGLGGADELYVSEFNRLLTSGDFEGAARCAATSPGGILRTQATITRFQSLPTPEGGQPPVLKYFAVLMEGGSKLNKVESIELSRPALAQGRVQLIEKWLGEDKISCSEALGDMVMPISPALALSIYLKAGDAHEKVVQAFLATGEYGKIVPYCAKAGYRPNFIFILQNLVHANPTAAAEFAKQLVKAEGGPLVEIPACIDVFMQFNRLPEASAFLVDVLAGDKPEEGFLQTKLLEMNLLGGAPQVANTILSSDMFHHFDKPRIASLCEKYQLYQRALDLYTEAKDIKRVLSIAAPALDPTWLTAYFGKLTAERAIDALGDMLKNPMAEQIVVRVAQQYNDQLTPEELIRLFENAKAFNGLYHYLGSIVNTSTHKLVHFKYIVAATNLKQYKEVERVCRDSQHYDPLAVKDFLLDAKLQDPRPLIHVCDRFGFTEELTSYLYNNKMQKFIEVYVQKVAPSKAPIVVGKLIDLDADEDFVKALLTAVGPLCPVQGLVEEVEKRNRLRLLQPFLEARVAEGTQEPSVHNAIGKIYITLNKDPQTWLRTNSFYDPLVVGKFCEKLDPFLAYLAYKRANGACDAQLIEVCSKNGLFKDLARYLVERQDEALWATVLSADNAHKREVIDQVTSTALPETKNPDEVSSTVKAFMAAKLPNELIGLLEKLVLTGSTEFATNKNLQNLLVLTAIRCANEPGAPPGRTMDYIERLDNFDGAEIAKIALRDEHGLFEEALAIYRKFDLHLDAVNVLLDKIGDIERAAEFAQHVNKDEVWSTLAHAQLGANLVPNAVASFIKANDARASDLVIGACEREGCYNDLIRFLEMARKGGMKERSVDTALAYAFAQTERVADLETFVTSPNVADMQQVGDRCYAEGLFQAARVLFTAVGNNAKLASTLVALGLFREAVDAAKKANSIRTWKEVNAACVRAGEFRLAQTAALNIIVSPDHLEELVSYYEGAGHWEELIKLLEQGVGLETAHAGIFTELGVQYSRHHPDKLMEHVKVFWARMNTSKMLRACEAGRHWNEAVYLYIQTNDFNQAVTAMMEHSPIAFRHDTFLECIVQVRNKELHYASLTFYVEEEPAGLAKLLQVLTPQLDHARVVHQFRKLAGGEYLPLILPYLRAVQKENISAVNEAVNSLLVEEEDIEGLRTSIAEHDNFDQVALAQRLEKHELLELRRIAAGLYKRNKRWEHSIALSKKDAQYKDAIDTARESGEQTHAEALLHFFVSNGDTSSFAATLYTCYPLIRADVAMELAWRYRMTDFVMPFMIQYIRDTNARITKLEERTKPKEDEAAAHAAAAGLDGGVPGYPGGFNTGVLALTDTPYNAPVGGMGYGMPGGYGAVPGAYGVGMPGYGMPGTY